MGIEERIESISLLTDEEKIKLYSSTYQNSKETDEEKLLEMQKILKYMRNLITHLDSTKNRSVESD